MKEIDWSKAPADATHWDTESNRFSKVKEGKAWFQSGFFWFISDADPSRFIPRPAPWTGEGLPPVGTVCEVEPHNTYWGLVTLGPVEMKIAAYHDDLVWLIDKEGKSHWTRTDKADFRPARTPEQIAAEEREKAIDAIQDDLSLSPECRYIAKRVYESGYRKVTP